MGNRQCSKSFEANEMVKILRWKMFIIILLGNVENLPPAATAMKNTKKTAQHFILSLTLYLI